MSEVDVPGDCDCVSGGGEMGARMRAFDWATTPLGSSEGWPQHLKDAIASHVSAAIPNAPGREDERRRVEAPPAEEALRESDARLRALIEEAPLAIALTGRSGEILLRNPRFDQLWGRPAHATTAATYSEVYEGYHLDGRQIASEEWPGARAVLKGETIENEVYEIVQATGNRIACWFGASPLRNTSGEIMGAVVVFRDVTDERRTAEALRKANAALAEAHRRKDEFIAVLSHELRNPLAPIRYALPLLGEEPLGERGRRATAVIERQVAHLVRLVDDLLDVSRIATGKMELRRDLFAPLDREHGGRSRVPHYRGRPAQPRHRRSRRSHLASRRSRTDLAGVHEPPQQWRKVHTAGGTDTTRGGRRRGERHHPRDRQRGRARPPGADDRLRDVPADR
jgi:PAS domain S-box-containing protein